MVNIPKKIENPIREGLVSKIYLNAFQKDKTGYKIADELDVRNHQVTRAINDFPQLFDRKKIREKKKPLRSKVDHFLKELEKNIELDQDEKGELKEYLDGSFRKATSKKYLKVDYDGQVDAYSELLGLLVSVLIVERGVRDAKAIYKRDIVKDSVKVSEEELYDAWQNRIPEEFELDPGPWEIDEVLEPVKSFSDDLLEKIERADLGGSREILKKHFRFYKKAIRLLMEDIRD